MPNWAQIQSFFPIRLIECRQFFSHSRTEILKNLNLPWRSSWPCSSSNSVETVFTLMGVVYGAPFNAPSGGLLLQIPYNYVFHTGTCINVRNVIYFKHASIYKTLILIKVYILKLKWTSQNVAENNTNQ